VTQSQSESAASGNHKFMTALSNIIEDFGHCLAQNALVDQTQCAVTVSEWRVDRNSEVCG
jgi:hypothetical protein